LLSQAFTGFSRDYATKLSGSLAYRTIFSLPPLLFLIILSAGYFWEGDAVQGRVFSELSGLIGAPAATQIQDVIKALDFRNSGTIATIVSAIALIVGATSIFTEIQTSLNHIWGVHPKSQKEGIFNLLINRLISFSMIIGLGFLVIVSLLADTLMLLLGKFLISHVPWLPLPLISMLNHAFLVVVLVFLFAFIFKVLPDVKLRWRDVLPGSIVTSALFIIGKFFIGLYVGQNNIISLYAAAGSVIVLLVWVYFSALIFYFGAEFSRAWVAAKGIVPEPSNFAESDKEDFWQQQKKRWGKR